MDKSHRYEWSILLAAVNFLATCALTEGAPLPAATTVTIPAPPTEDLLNRTKAELTRSTLITPPAPTGHRISFFKNTECALHSDKSEATSTKSIVCGMRELGLPKSAGNGVRFWLPGKCQRYHCECIATRDVYREKRSVVDNKIEVVQKRFRVFECV